MFEAKVFQSSTEHVIPVVWTAAQAIQCFVEKPVGVVAVLRIPNRWYNDGKFFRW